MGQWALLGRASWSRLLGAYKNMKIIFRLVIDLEG